MKKFYSILLLIFLLIGFFDTGLKKNWDALGVALAAPLDSDNRLGEQTTILKRIGTDIAPIRKNPPKESVPRKDPVKTQLDIIKNSGVINIAFFGLDRRNPNEGSRSDSIMVVSIDEKSQKIKVTSLMRDMYIPIPGRGSNRINSAYAFGGPALAINTINTNFGFDIKDYVMVDFFGLEKLIDSIGGVRINVSNAEAEILNISMEEIDNLTGSKAPKIKGGNQSLSGRQAVAYCRIREVGYGDYERTERQRRVLNEILRKIKQEGIGKLPKTITNLLPYVKTSLSAGEVLKLGLKGIGFKSDNTQQYRLPVDGTYQSKNIRGMDVLVPNIEENKKKLYEFVYGIK